MSNKTPCWTWYCLTYLSQVWQLAGIFQIEDFSIAVGILNCDNQTPRTQNLIPVFCEIEIYFTYAYCLMPNSVSSNKINAIIRCLQQTVFTIFEGWCLLRLSKLQFKKIVHRVSQKNIFFLRSSPSLIRDFFWGGGCGCSLFVI